MKWLLGYHSEFSIRNHLFAHQNFRTMKYRKRNSLSNLLLERFWSNLLTNWIFRFPTAYEHIVFMIKVLNFKFRKNIISSPVYQDRTKWTRNLITGHVVSGLAVHVGATSCSSFNTGAFCCRSKVNTNSPEICDLESFL